jgi:site-specific DNA-methyltransferase (adenine-specific)
MTTKKGDLVFDPFGGSGTTFMAAELKQRRWIGSEIGSPDVIIERFNQIEEERQILNQYRSKINSLFPKDT